MMTRSFTMLAGILQATLLVLFVACTTYDHTREYSAAEYAIFRDIMVMLLLGFGFLMTFLRKYGLSAVGLTMMLTVVSMQLNLFMEPLAHHLYGSDVEYPLQLSVASLIDSEFSAATLLISYGAVIGRASPTQLLIMAFFQSIFYSINKAMIVFGALGAEDVGGTITIHLFGAYFGMAVSRVFATPKQFSSQNNESSAVSDVLAMIGTTLLWVYWPSFVGATETASPTAEGLCILHTVLALLGSTGATFFLSHALLGKFDPVHIANSTLAGGVAIGASARLEMSPGGALVLGVLAGLLSVIGYVYVTPMLERNLAIYDTCGVHNLHGLPSFLGGLASAVFVTIDSNAEFLEHAKGTQAARQIEAVLATLALALASGYLTGFIMVKTVVLTPAEYDDAAWWEGEYLEDLDSGEIDKSQRSLASITPDASEPGV